jgi:hypothetical protein
MNKLTVPIVTLSSEAEIQKFLTLENEWEEKTKFFEKTPIALGDTYKNRRTKTRVIAFLFDKADFADEVKTLKQSAKFCSKRDELRIAMVTDKKLIKKYKASYGNLWFPEGTYSSLVLKRYDNRYFSHDFLNGAPTLGFSFWINK